MQIKDVENLAELAKIKLTEEEKEHLLSDMEGILGYVKQIQEVDVEDIIPEYEHRNIWREDVLEKRDFSEDIIRDSFPDSQPARPHDNSGAGGDGIFVKVKKIM